MTSPSASGAPQVSSTSPRQIKRELTLARPETARLNVSGRPCPRTFDPAEPGAIDMWLGPTTRPITQPQIRDAQLAQLS